MYVCVCLLVRERDFDEVVAVGVGITFLCFSLSVPLFDVC